MTNYSPEIYRFELSFDQKTIPVLKIINKKTAKITKKITGPKVYNFINNLAQNEQISQIVKNNKNMKLSYQQSNIEITIKNYSDMDFTYNKVRIAPFVGTINAYKKNNKIIEVKKSQVTRNNKYSSQKINMSKKTRFVCATLAAVLTLSGLIALSSINKKGSPLTDDTSITETQIESPDDPNEKVGIARLEVNELYGDNLNKFNYCKEHFYDIMCKYCHMYGVDPNIILAIATIENGYLIEKEGSSAIGLMEIRYDTWAGTDERGNIPEKTSISCHNFITGQKDRYEFTKDSLKDPEINIRVGVMMYRHIYDNYENKNALLSVQTYNSGCGRINQILKKAVVPDYLDENDKENQAYSYNELLEKGKKFLYRINNNNPSQYTLDNVDIEYAISLIDNEYGLKKGLPNDKNIKYYNYEDLITYYSKIIKLDKTNTIWIDPYILSGKNETVCKSCDGPKYMYLTFQFYQDEKITMIERKKDSNGNYINGTYNDGNIEYSITEIELNRVKAKTK